MRKVIYALANSLDGFIAREGGAVDWLLMEGEHMRDFAESFKNFDAVLMGRKTYEFGLSHGMTAYPNLENYVFSGAMRKSPDQRVTIINGNAGEFVRELRNKPGKDIWLCGGSNLAQTLFDEGLIDQVICNVHPVLLGSGIPLFPKLKRQVDLNLESHKVYSNGLVLLAYRVDKQP